VKVVGNIRCFWILDSGYWMFLDLTPGAFPDMQYPVSNIFFTFYGKIFLVPRDKGIIQDYSNKILLFGNGR